MSETATDWGYEPPVATLLTYRACQTCNDSSDWPNYVEELGLTAEHIPELIRLAVDERFDELTYQENTEVWAPTHAWRALAQLKAEAAIEPLMVLFDHGDDDWSTIELPWVYTELGPAAMPALQTYLRSDQPQVWPKISAIDCLVAIAQRYPETKEGGVAVLVEQLASFADNDEELNSFLVNALLNLEVVEAAGLIEQVYESGRIDEFVTGTWARVQVELGLKVESDFSPEDFRIQPNERMMAIAKAVELLGKTKERTKSKGFGESEGSKPKKSKKKRKK